MGLKKFPTLYKQSSTGKVQQWDIDVVVRRKDQIPLIVVKHGQVGGKIQETDTEVKSGKNIGRSNETTPLHQALLEAESKWKKQLDKGYSEQQGGVSLATKPMLAHDYQKYKHQITFPAFCQAKLDGIRCLAHAYENGVVLFSRMGKEHVAMNHIASELASLMKPGEIWDGELYIHGVPFQKLTSWVKKYQPDSLRVNYHVYDCIGDEDYHERIREVHRRIVYGETDHIRPVPYFQVNSDEEVWKNHDELVGEGYEGAIVRANGCPYKAGYRSRTLLKAKAFLDEDFVIAHVDQGKGKFAGIPIFTLKTDQGVSFDADSVGTDEYRRLLYEDRDNLIGKMATVRFFEWTTSSPPAPRFPKLISVRDYE